MAESSTEPTIEGGRTPSLAASLIVVGVMIGLRFYYVTVFLIASVFCMLLGSSFTMVWAVGVAFVGLASIMGVSPTIAAGAAVSGVILGDKTAKISDTANLTIATVSQYFAGMLSTIWLILMAASFGAVADYPAMLRQAHHHAGGDLCDCYSLLS